MSELFNEPAGIPLSQLQKCIDDFLEIKDGLSNGLRSNRGEQANRLALKGVIKANLVINRLRNEQIHLAYLKDKMNKDVRAN